jgi:hypothetical protein
MPEPSATHIKKALVASLVKLEKTSRLTAEELEWLRGSVMRLVSEFSILQESKSAPGSSETHAA